MPVSYKNLGLANTNDMFRRAFAGRYAVPASFKNMAASRPFITACVETRAAGHPPDLERRPEVRQPNAPPRPRALSAWPGRWRRPRARTRPSRSPFTSTMATPSSWPVYRKRLLVGHDRRLASSLRRERRADQEGRRIRPAADVSVEGELGRWRVEDDVTAENSSYTHPERGPGLRQAVHGRFARHLHRDHSRRPKFKPEQFTATAGHRRPAASPVRHTGRGREAAARLPHRPSRGVLGASTSPWP